MQATVEEFALFSAQGKQVSGVSTDRGRCQDLLNDPLYRRAGDHIRRRVLVPSPWEPVD
jgi:hypothetical protein